MPILNNLIREAVSKKQSSVDWELPTCVIDAKMIETFYEQLTSQGYTVFRIPRPCRFTHEDYCTCTPVIYSLSIRW